MKAIRKVIGQHVQQLRKANGWSQSELARELGPGWSLATVSDAERGLRAWVIDDLYRVATVLRVGIPDLVTSPEPIETAGGWTYTPNQQRAAMANVHDGRLQFQTVVALAGALRTTETAYAEAVNSFVAHYAEDPELMDWVEDQGATVESAEQDALRETARDDLAHAALLDGQARGPETFTDAEVAARIRDAYPTAAIPITRAAADVVQAARRSARRTK